MKRKHDYDALTVICDNCKWTDDISMTIFDILDITSRTNPCEFCNPDWILDEDDLPTDCKHCLGSGMLCPPVGECPECNALVYADCPKCHGKDIPCSCDGSMDCDLCYGTGAYSYKECDECGGLGLIW